MGAKTFTQFEQRTGDDDTMLRAFSRARDQAAYEYGHGGYTGTLAEKGESVLIQEAPVTYDHAINLAQHLIDEADPRIDDKWGPAGAIRVKGGQRKVFVSGGYNTNAKGLPATPGDQRKKNAIGWQSMEYDGWLFFGWASS